MATHPLTGVRRPAKASSRWNDIGGVRWRNIHNVYLEIAVDLGIPRSSCIGAPLRRAPLRRGGEAAWSAADVDLYYLAQGSRSA